METYWKKFTQRFNIYNKYYLKWPISVEYNDGEELYRIFDYAQALYIARPRRTIFYWEGVEKRLKNLAAQYMLDQIPFEHNDIVIDVGANVGELGKWLSMIDLNIKYYALEPSLTEWKANIKNNMNATCLNIGAWDKDETLEFFDRNDTGDSSLFRVSNNESPTKIIVKRIDQIKEIKDITAIKLLKVETEGAEPEALRGAMTILNKTEYITVDCGFERGAEAQSTANDVLNILANNKFTCIGCNPTRLVLLFKRQDIK